MITKEQMAVVVIDLVGFADIVKSLEKDHHFGPEATAMLTTQIQEQFIDKGLETVKLTRGDVVMTNAGDNAISIFSHAKQALEFASAVHKTTEIHNANIVDRLAQRWFRVGIATGEIIVDRANMKIDGYTIAIAKRLEEMAGAGENLICVNTFVDLPREIRDNYGEVERITGKRDEIFGAHRSRIVAINRKKKNPIDNADLVWVPAGKFVMGSSEIMNRSNEMPQRYIYLDEYWIYDKLVTVAQYRKFHKRTNHPMPNAPAWGLIDDHPIVNVTWEDAQAYAHWVNMELPTEAQWEKAARGTDGRIYPWDSVWDENKCCNSINSDNRTAPVGNFANGMSPYGCLNMVGNVWEWCADYYEKSYNANVTHNPRGPIRGSVDQWRVVRGCAFNDHRQFMLTTTVRDEVDPKYAGYLNGFRCVLPS